MNILVGYNASYVAKSALELARKHAKAFGAKVYVMSSSEGGAKEKLDDVSLARKELASAKEFIEKEGVECEVVQMARGLSPGEDLVRFTKEKSIDHLYVGIEKKSKTQKLLLGSTAQFVILKANCPVTTVK
jgi:nucleotide-binding universal stress UspA family protein